MKHYLCIWLDRSGSPRAGDPRKPITAEEMRFAGKQRASAVLARLSGFGLLVALASGSASLPANALDPHRIYEEKCGRCHSPHAGEFVRKSLSMDNGRLHGRKTGQEVRRFLANGHGKLSKDEVLVLMNHLKNIRQAGGLFRKKCIICHDRAVKLARLELIIRDGKLIGRYTDRNMEEFLMSHGGLKGDEVAKMIGVLKRHLSTIERK